MVRNVSSWYDKIEMRQCALRHFSVPTFIRPEEDTGTPPRDPPVQEMPVQSMITEPSPHEMVAAAKSGCKFRRERKRDLTAGP